MTGWALATAAAVSAVAALPPVASVELKAAVHYPEAASPLEFCGFQLQVAASLSSRPSEQPQRATATHVSANLFAATLQLPDAFLYERAEVGVLAFPAAAASDACQAVCARLSPGSSVVQTGRFLETAPLELDNTVELWPAFCSQDFASYNHTFLSMAIGRNVTVTSRMPGAFIENALRRPSAALPTVMFRFNAEWYWPGNDYSYKSWHELMVSGTMVFFASAEIYIDNVSWTSWDDQPIFTVGKPDEWPCDKCDDDMRFICDSWESSGYFLYRGGNHSYGKAAEFFDELYDKAVPSVFGSLLPSSDGGTLSVGAWGYCIGGLAALNAVMLRPRLFNIGYLGSPAVDFNCGAPLKAVDSLQSSWLLGAHRPKIYIDSGAAEGVLMNRQTLMLFRKLQAKGLVEGKDLFYTREPFGTHQNSQMWRRAQQGLLVIFGARRKDGHYPFAASRYVQVSSQGTVMSQPENIREGGQELSGILLFMVRASRHWRELSLAVALGAAAWTLGRRSARWLPSMSNRGVMARPHIA